MSLNYSNTNENYIKSANTNWIYNNTSIYRTNNANERYINNGANKKNDISYEGWKPKKTELEQVKIIT